MTLISSRTLDGSCPACGAWHAACGTPSESVPVDDRVEVAAVGGPLKRYTVSISGTETVMKLNEADAERLGAVLVTEDASVPRDVPGKKRAVSNKARTVASKDGGTGGDD